MLNLLQKHQIDALEEALGKSIEKTHQFFTCECEKLCFCTCLFGNYFSNQLADVLSHEKVCEIFWTKIMNEFNYKIEVNLLSVVLENSNINRELFENLKNTYCK